MPVWLQTPENTSSDQDNSPPSSQRMATSPATLGNSPGEEPVVAQVLPRQGRGEAAGRTAGRTP